MVLADDDRRSAIEVACRNDAVAGEEKHRDRASHLTVHVLDAVDEVLALGDEQCHKFRRVGVAMTQLSEVLFVVEALLLEFLDVGDLGHCHDGELAKMRVHHNRLCVGVADDSDAAVAHEFVDLVLEFRSEVRAFQAVD